jgi:hypothetical protein
MQDIRSAKSRLAIDLAANPHFGGIGIGARDGIPVLSVIWFSDDSSAVPAEVDGFPVEVARTDMPEAF